MMEADVQEPNQTTQAIVRSLLTSHPWMSHWPKQITRPSQKLKGRRNTLHPSWGHGKDTVICHPMEQWKNATSHHWGATRGRCEPRQWWEGRGPYRRPSATDWFQKEGLMHQLLNRNSLSCQDPEGRSHLSSAPLSSQRLAQGCCAVATQYLLK